MYTEPWRAVEFTAGARASAAMAIPKWVIIKKSEYHYLEYLCSTFTKVIFIDEGRCVILCACLKYKGIEN